MSQHDLDIANQTFPNTRSDLNNALKALGSNSSGTSVPSTPYANQFWYDTANNLFYIRNEDNDANIEIMALDQSNDTVEYFKSDSIRTALVEYSDGTDAFTIGSDGTVAFDTNTLYVDATNNKVGIGTSSPSSPLEVVGGAPLASGFTQSRSGHPTFGITNGGTDSVYFHLAPSGGSHQTFMQVRDDDTDVNSIAFSTSGTEAMRIDSSGNVGIGTSSNLTGKINLPESDYGEGINIFSSGTEANRCGIGHYAYDTRIYYGGSDSLTFVDGGPSGTERMRIDSNGRLGIGTSSPEAILHVSTGGGIAPFASTQIISESTGNNYIELNGGNTSTTALYFGDSNDQDVGGILYNHSNNSMSFRANASERMRIDSSGNILLSTTSTYPGSGNTNGGTMVENSSADGTSFFVSRKTNIACYFNRNNDGSVVSLRRGGSEVGSISVTASNTSYNTSSDYRLKENVDYTFDATSRLKQLKPCRFNFKADTDRIVDGFIAHEVSDIVPEAVTGEKDAMMTEEYEVTPAVLDDDGNTVEEAVMGTREVPDYQGIDQSKLVPLLVKTIQELEARITTLENN
jgi:hypothetical protein